MYHYENATTKHHSVMLGDHATNATRRHNDTHEHSKDEDVF